MYMFTNFLHNLYLLGRKFGKVSWEAAVADLTTVIDICI
jgi:hypothetical protein